LVVITADRPQTTVFLKEKIMKHLLLSATLLLFSSSLIAQLHVQPNPSSSTDSYVYANDVVLYVHQDVSLVNNTNDATTNASIYLRGDAQLIQGDKAASLNTGTGKLSVWQRGYANAFDYNYWASPVGVANATTGNTNAGIARIFDVQDQQTTPHVTHSLQQVSIGGLNGIPSGSTFGTNLRVSSRWIYTMRAMSGYGNWIYIGNVNSLAAGQGFTMKGTGTTGAAAVAHDQLYDFRGRPNDGNISVVVAGTTSAPQETLTGNPYPSALDMEAFLMHPSNNNILGSAFYWDQNRETNSHYINAYEGGYGSWQPAGGITIPEGGTSGTVARPVYLMYNGSGVPVGLPTGMLGDSIQRRFAPIGQGFMVRGIAPGTANFTNSMRVYVPQSTSAYSIFRNPGASSLSASSGGVVVPPPAPEYVYPTLRFSVEVNDSYARDMVMMFAEESTKGEDRGYDSRHPLVIPAGDAFWKLEDLTAPFVIQTRPFDEYDVIPLGIKTKNGANSFKVKVVEAHNFTNNMYLFDLQNNHYQRLGLNDDATINYSGGAGTITNRFFIVFRRGIQDDNIPTKIAEMNIDFFQNNRLSQLEVYNPDVIDIKTAWVFDMSGKKVIEEKNLGMQRSYSFSTANLSSGVYMVVLTTVDDLVVDYKVTVHNKN